MGSMTLDDKVGVLNAVAKALEDPTGATVARRVVVPVSVWKLCEALAKRMPNTNPSQVLGVAAAAGLQAGAFGMQQLAQQQAARFGEDGKLTLDYRAQLYSEAFPDYPRLIVDKGWLLGVWNIGNNYKGSGYHGCLDPMTPVLTADLRWVENGDLKVGDVLVGVDEDGDGRSRKLRRSVVEDIGPVRLESCIVGLASGQRVTCSTNHLWLVRRNNTTRWIEAGELRPGDRIRRVCSTWEQRKRSHDAGWLSGIIDGEGSIDGSVGLRITIHQNEGAVLDRCAALLDKFEIPYTDTGRRPCVELRTTSTSDSLKLLGSVGSVRFQDAWVGSGLGKTDAYDAVERVTPVGVRDLVGMSTSTRTFVAEGLASHNSYPPSYLKRITPLFPDCPRVLHLFSGSLPPGDYVRFDRRTDLPNGVDVVGEAEDLYSVLSAEFEDPTFDIVFADPPYTGADAEKYGTCLVNRNKVVDQCSRVVRPGGFLIWMDQVLPMYRKAEWKRCIEIAISRSTNHRVRAVFGFQRLQDEEPAEATPLSLDEQREAAMLEF